MDATGDVIMAWLHLGRATVAGPKWEKLAVSIRLTEARKPPKAKRRLFMRGFSQKFDFDTQR
jgi:hypothetical protein